MKTFNLTLLSLIIALIFNSNKISAQVCISFQDTALSLTIATTQANYGSPWYSNNGVLFTSKYFDYTMMGLPGDVHINDHVTAGYTGSNGSSNYAGNIFYQGNVITQIDFSSLAINPKQIEFDVNGINNNGSVNPYYVNGSPLNTLPVGVTYTATPLTNGYHITLTGNINTIEIHGFEIGIDNLCVDSLTINPPLSGCLDFNDTNLVVGNIPTNDTTYNSVDYSSQGVDFSVKYEDHLGFPSLQPGSYQIKDSTGGWSGIFDMHPNFSGSMWWLGNVAVKIDLNNVSYTNKKVTFDISNQGTSSLFLLQNPFRVNGMDENTLPGGVTYSYNYVGLAANGGSSYQVEINGPITTLEWYGFEVGFDNLCVDSATTPCTNYAGFTFTVTGNAVQFTNTSLVNSTNANQFIWDFGDGNNSGDNDPLHTYPGPGTYYVCLTIVDFSCPTNPTFQYCDSVVIGNCPNSHKIITPNNDGQADEVFIPKGSKIFDRNGFMVREIKQDMNWKGRDDSNQILPMGYYTITCGNGGEIFNITIIR